MLNGLESTFSVICLMKFWFFFFADKPIVKNNKNFENRFEYLSSSIEINFPFSNFIPLQFYILKKIYVKVEIRNTDFENLKSKMWKILS